MSEIEIALRCPSCGASIRESALFCPQCGKPLPQHHAGSAAHSISEGAGAVEKWRQISSTVLDEATYDPSLRFVLVAAVLFILFLVMLIVSELIT
jgi:uncharacterized membrane protein YvbJ